MPTDDVADDGALRARAIERLRKRRAFFTHLLVFLVVNALLVVIWAVGSRGVFWPIFVIVGWGIAVVLHGWGVLRPSDENEERIRQEMERIRQR